MSGVDVVARAVAVRATSYTPRPFVMMAGTDIPAEIERVETTGYYANGRGHGSYISDSFCDDALLNTFPLFCFRAADGRIFRLIDQNGEIGVEQGGAVGDGLTDNSPILQSAQGYCDHTGIARLRLGVGTFGVRGAGGLNWTSTGLALCGMGMDRSIVRQLDHSTTLGSACQLFDSQGLHFEDLTFHGANSYGSLYVAQDKMIANALFRRVRFTSDLQNPDTGSWYASTNGIRWVTDTGSARNIRFEDCLFENCGRMGVEFQNHGTGTNARYSDIQFLRPRFVNIGQANTNAGFTAGMGISLSGYGDNVLVESPYFDNVARICIEMVGCSRTIFRNIRVRHDTLGAALIQATNSKPMYGNVIDGLRFTGEHGQVITGSLVPVNTTIRLDNWHGGVVRDCELSVIGDKALRLGVSYASTSNLIEANRFESSNNVVVENFQSAENRFVGNTITSTFAGAISGLVGIFGDNSTHCLIDSNSFKAPNATSWNPINLSGLASAKFTMSNKLAGKIMRSSGTFTLAAGSSYVGVDHGLGTIPKRYGITPKGRVYNSGFGDMVPYSGVASNVINAATSNTVSANVIIHWWAEADYGNL